MQYPSLSGCSSISLGGSSVVRFSAAAIVAACILDHMIFLIPCGSGSPPSLGADGFFFAIVWLRVVWGVQALVQASAGWGVRDCHGVDDTEYSEYVSGPTVPNHIRMGMVGFWVIGLF